MFLHYKLQRSSITLIETKKEKRGRKKEEEGTYCTPIHQEEFGIRSVYILGTMNTADDHCIDGYSIA